MNVRNIAYPISSLAFVRILIRSPLVSLSQWVIRLGCICWRS